VSCGSRIALRWRAVDTLDVAYTVDENGVEVWQRHAVQSAPSTYIPEAFG
jgi:hypothetical protein